MIEFETNWVESLTDFGLTRRRFIKDVLMPQLLDLRLSLLRGHGVHHPLQFLDGSNTVWMVLLLSGDDLWRWPDLRLCRCF